MKIVNKVIDIIDKILNFVIYALFLLLLAFGIYCIQNNLSILDESNLPKDIVKLRPTTDFNLKELQKINPDIVGWVTIRNNNVDYPIVKSADNLEYLNKNYKQEFSLAGSIFMDYRNSSDKLDYYTVLFGHNMEKNKMFSDINDYQNDGYIDTHSRGTIFVGNEKHNFTMYAFMNVDGYDEEIYNINHYTDGLTDHVIEKIKNLSVVYRDAPVDTTSKIVLFSTCSRSDEKKRSVAVAVIDK